MSDNQSREMLLEARSRFSQQEIADRLGKDAKTVRRWEKGETPCPVMLDVYRKLWGPPSIHRRYRPGRRQ